ncbi:MAG: 2'-deoxycytidine 5'-triphosphate deaminase [Rhodobiaceae bacterium]|nr:2'-deoxycytidine 5'-triphosphate deaminase [Rhodobiaceae bacterium]
MAKPMRVVDSSKAPKGILPSHAIERLAEAGAIVLARPLAEGQVQPASLDLRLGARAYRVRASFLPGARASVQAKLERLALHEIDLSQGAVLETGCVYIVPLLESLDLPAGLAAACNPKSSTGRLDIFTRVIADHAHEFDNIDAGYRGPLYIEISPRTFPILVREGSRLSQIRFRRGHAPCSDEALRALHAREGLVSTREANIDGGLALSVDLAGNSDSGLIGYRAKRHTALIDVDRPGAYAVGDFWDPIEADRDRSLILDPDQFYILASKEAVHVPPGFAAEMIPFNPLVGEFRVHYAGFFDPGFGHSASGGSGSRAVLEVRSHDVPFILEDGQIIGRLVYEPLTETPGRIYGSDIGSNYQRQGLKLSKHFRQ